MQKRTLGHIAIPVFALINVLLWLFFMPGNSGNTENFVRQVVGEMLGSTAIVLMGCALFLAARPRFLEPYFGGLDQMYQAHKRAAMLAMLLLLIHFLAVPIDANNVKIGSPLGMIALVGLFILILLTVAPRIPVIGRFTRFAYHKWKKSHKIIGIFFIIGFFHAMAVDPLAQSAAIPFTYLRIFFFLGLAAYLYTELAAKAFRKTPPFTVEAVRNLNGSTVEVTLKPQNRKLEFKAGQFLYVGFPGDKVLEEPHPFTVSSSPNESHLRLSVKAAGDFTRYLYQNLKPGVQASIDGCYGMFDYKNGGPQQIWIAAGIGITPFYPGSVTLMTGSILTLISIIPSEPGKKPCF